MPLHCKLLLAVLAFVATPACAAPATLAGSVTYVEKIALPTDAMLHIRLIDETAPGAPARIDAHAPIGAIGQVPLNFTLAFDDQIIAADHSYAIIAEIGAGGRLWFRNFEAYALNPLAPATPVMVTVSFVGQIANAATPTEDEVTNDAPPPPAILNTTWHATSIGGTPALPHSDTTLSIDGDKRAGGRGGCNSYFAQAELDDVKVQFSAVTKTSKSCGYDINMQEKAFFEALAAVRSWSVETDTLSLLDASGAVLMTLSR